MKSKPQMDPKTLEIIRLNSLLSKFGICPNCEQEIYHWETEPFSSCKCFDGAEDTTGPSIIQKLRKQIHNLSQEAEQLLEERNDVVSKYNQDRKSWENKWKCAVEMAAIAENKLAAIKNLL